MAEYVFVRTHGGLGTHGRLQTYFCLKTWPNNFLCSRALVPKQLEVLESWISFSDTFSTKTTELCRILESLQVFLWMRLAIGIRKGDFDPGTRRTFFCFSLSEWLAIGAGFFGRKDMIFESLLVVEWEVREVGHWTFFKSSTSGEREHHLFFVLLECCFNLNNPKVFKHSAFASTQNAAKWFDKLGRASSSKAQPQAIFGTGTKHKFLALIARGGGSQTSYFHEIELETQAQESFLELHSGTGIWHSETGICHKVLQSSSKFFCACLQAGWGFAEESMFKCRAAVGRFFGRSKKCATFLDPHWTRVCLAFPVLKPSYFVEKIMSIKEIMPLLARHEGALVRFLFFRSDRFRKMERRVQLSQLQFWSRWQARRCSRLHIPDRRFFSL